MKRIQVVFVILITILLCTGCFDVIEKYQLNEDGSGKYIVDVDFSRTASSFTSMISSMSEEDQTDAVSKRKKEVKDSIIYFETQVDSATELSEIEKKVLRKSSARMFIDEPNGQFKITLFYPFAKADELGVIQTAMSRQSYSGEEGAGMKMILDNDKLGKFFTLSKQNSFEFQMSSNHIERKIGSVDTAWVSFEEQNNAKNDLGIMSMFTDMYKFSMKTEIELPRSLKKIETRGSTTISTDRKKVSIIHMENTSATLRPKDFAYRIEF
ncbi:MAG TPA: hypothetical protein DHW64_00985 [Chitinophagaceae bacterium]|nr:hypothetical protein [Chitinophagaceae bacterium]